jgi:ParB family chromosome partitioning protein
MKEQNKKIALTRYDDLFVSSDQPNSTPTEMITSLPLDQLHPFADHPFKLYSEDKMQEMVESITKYGVLTPILVRPQANGEGYEVVSGHNRVEAAKLAGINEIPATVRQMDDETAIIAMIDSNLRQREKLFPSEKAFAYKMKLDAIRKRAGRPSSENSGQVDLNSSRRQSRDIVAEDAGESGKQIQRFIRLTELIPPLLNLVDENKLAFNPAVAISYLRQEQQIWLEEIMTGNECSPSLSQAERLKQISQDGKLDRSAMDAVMMEPKVQQPQIIIKQDRISKYFPRDVTPQQMEETIIKLLENWYRKRNQEVTGR